MGRVAGKVALVAGAGGGIGGAGAEALAREGAAVFCTDRDGTAAESTAARIRTAGGQAAASALDVRDRVAIDAAVAAVVREFAGSTSCSNWPGSATGAISWMSMPRPGTASSRST